MTDPTNDDPPMEAILRKIAELYAQEQSERPEAPRPAVPERDDGRQNANALLWRRYET